jgi:hypothetical protein
MKEATNHAKAIRRAARLREKYSLKVEFFNEAPAAEEQQQLIEEEKEIPHKVTSRHTLGNVMDLFPPKEKQKNEDLMMVAAKKRTSGLVATSEKGMELTRQSDKLDEFMAKREGKVLTGDRVVFDEEKGEKKSPDQGLGQEGQGLPVGQQEGKSDANGDHLLGEDDEEVNPNDIIPPIVYNWISSIVENLSPSISYSTQQQRQAQLEDPENETANTTTRVRAGTLDKLDQMMYTSSIKFKCLEFFMESLENIVITPIVYLCKGLDPIALNLALEYVATNELTSNIIVLHIVDDRNVISSHHQIIRKLLSFGMEKSLLRRYHKKLLIEHVTGVLQDKLRTTRTSTGTGTGMGTSTSTGTPTTRYSLEKKKTALSVTDVYEEVEYELENILGNLPEEIRSLPKLVSLFDTLYM